MRNLLAALILWMVVNLAAGGGVMAATREEVKPVASSTHIPKNVVIYLDESKSLVRKDPGSPHLSLANMLEDMLNEKHQFIGPQDNLYFYRFADFVESGKNPIPAGKKADWKKYVEEYKSPREGRDLSDFSILFKHLNDLKYLQENNAEATSSVVNIVIIVSDFVNDPRNEYCEMNANYDEAERSLKTFSGRLSREFVAPDANPRDFLILLNLRPNVGKEGGFVSQESLESGSLEIKIEGGLEVERSPAGTSVRTNKQASAVLKDKKGKEEEKKGPSKRFVECYYKAIKEGRLVKLLEKELNATSIDYVGYETDVEALITTIKQALTQWVVVEGFPNLLGPGPKKVDRLKIQVSNPNPVTIRLDRLELAPDTTAKADELPLKDTQPDEFLLYAREVKTLTIPLNDDLIKKYGGSQPFFVRFHHVPEPLPTRRQDFSSARTDFTWLRLLNEPRFYRYFGHREERLEFVVDLEVTKVGNKPLVPGEPKESIRWELWKNGGSEALEVSEDLIAEGVPVHTLHRRIATRHSEALANPDQIQLVMRSDSMALTHSLDPSRWLSPLPGQVLLWGGSWLVGWVAFISRRHRAPWGIGEFGALALLGVYGAYGLLAWRGMADFFPWFLGVVTLLLTHLLLLRLLILDRQRQLDAFMSRKDITQSEETYLARYYLGRWVIAGVLTLVIMLVLVQLTLDYFATH